MSEKMTGAELASLLKGQLNEKIHSNMKLNGLDGVDDESLHLTDEQVKWWRDAKFGMFIHWGVYSVLSRGEWTYFNDKLDEDDYRDVAANEYTAKAFMKPAQDALSLSTGCTSARIKTAKSIFISLTAKSFRESPCRLSKKRFNPQGS